MIVRATLEDAEVLTEIAVKSKAYWGYENDQVESWREDLTVTPKMFDESNIYKYIVDNQIGGFYILERANIRTRIYFRIDNALSELGERNYFSAPNYPYRDFTIRFGLVWNWFI